MKKILFLTILLSTLSISSFAIENDVSVTQTTCDGPFRTMGDLELFKKAIENSKSALVKKCMMTRTSPSRKNSIQELSFNEGQTVICITITVQDHCISM